jgi:hypothetical protein
VLKKYFQTFLYAITIQLKSKFSQIKSFKLHYFICIHCILADASAAVGKVSI